MRRRRHYWHEDVPEYDKIAAFAGASIVRDLHGRYQIQGGTEVERKQAHDWMLRFMWPVGKPKPARWPGIAI